MDKENKLWFKRRKYGWGWTPSNKKGWAVILGYLILMIAYPMLITPNSFPLFAIVASALLVFVCYAKGETPKWQWGDK